MELIIAQLTDIHIKQKSDLDILLQRTNSIVGAIFEVVRNAKETMLLICVTGDVAFSGTEEQYGLAENFFDDIYEKIISRSFEIYVQFIFVPGNHDCDFASKENKVRTTVIKSSELDMNDDTTMEICTSIQANYFNFVNYYAEKKLASLNRRNSIFTQNVIINEKLGKYNIKLHCLNTAWCSSLHEKKDMLFSVPEGIDKKNEDDIVITLMHHGENWFHWKGVENWENYHKEYSDIILIGHDHFSQFVQKTNYDSTTNYFIKGNQLYSTEEPDQSGFNIFKVNLEDNIEFFYTYSWNGKLFERVIDSKARRFERNRYSKYRISIARELRERLEDIEIDISSKYKSPLLLSDIYVFPPLKGENLNNSNKTQLYRGQESILNIIQTQKKVLINGDKEYGKTALLKRLFVIFYSMDLFPIFIDVGDIRSANEDDTNTLIREAYKSSYYNLNVDEILQKEKENRVCLIDDFDETILGDKSQKVFLEYINTQFDIVILTENNRNSLVDVAKNLETNDFINNMFYTLEITQLRRYGKSKIVDKWLLLEDPEQDINSKEFDGKRKDKLSQMQNVLKNGYFRNTPLEFLLVLSYMENSEAMNTDYSRFSYVYDCLIRDKINDISEQDSKMALAYRTLLEILAYDLYSNDESATFDEQYVLESIANYNENYPRLMGNSVKIIQRLVQYKILEERNDKYKFKYDYMYYYFAGSYIVEVLSPEERDKKTKEILLNLSLEKNYNIGLFMAYSMNPQHEILPKLQSISAELLSEYKEFKYEDQKEFLKKINSDVLEKLNEIYSIPENSEIPQIQENKKIRQDDIEEEKEKEEVQKRADEYLDVIFNDFIKLLRMIEFQGDILKNYATKIKNQPRTDMIELMGSSNLKLIGFLCNRVSTETDKIIEIVEKKVKEGKEAKIPEKDALLSLIKDYVSILWSEFIEINVDNLAYCWECDLLENDIIAYKERMQSAFFDMVNVEFKLRITDDKLPVDDIERCLTGKRKLGSFSKNIMKNIIASYLSSYQYDSKDKERVCNLLEFNYKKLYIEDQKNAALGLN
ncbi:MAG: metallophosphoesterase [Lachnospiraceae bacterium]|nr:metallophosphoesterase [Lachnospiraceae bacterium]